MLQHSIAASSPTSLSVAPDVKKPAICSIPSPSTSSFTNNKKPLPPTKSLLTTAATPRLPSTNNNTASKEKPPSLFDFLSPPAPTPKTPITPITLSTPSPVTTNTTTSPPMSPIQQIHSPSSMSLYSMGSEQLLDHSHLKPGDNASLLSYAKTINMYRANARKTNDVEIQCDFAIFLVEAAKRLDENGSDGNNDAVDDEDEVDGDASGPTSTSGTIIDEHQASAHAYFTEAEKLLKQVSLRGHSPSQYYLANMYSSGLLHKSNKFEYDRAFPLYVQAAKHHHPDAAYRTAKCYEDGLGTRRDKAKAVQFYRKAATLNHPGAMYRLGIAEMKGELGLSSNIRDGHKWLKRSAEASTTEYPHALHELGHLHERGLASIIFQDHDYAIKLYQDASELGYAPSCFRLGECYEFGRLGCDVNPRLSMHYYGLAAEQGHSHACFALTAWYLIGVPGWMEPSDEQAFAWALRAAQGGLARAEYAVGYFYEVGIGIQRNQTMALEYYQKAANHGEKRAMQRLQTSVITPFEQQQQQQTPYATSPSHHPSSSYSSTPNSLPSQQQLQQEQRSGTQQNATWIKKWKQKLGRQKSS